MSAYSPASKLLHWLVLNFRAVREASFDIERKMFLESLNDARDQRHVFVCGLARAGTTILMRQIYRSNKFASLIYQDMPFIMSPNCWAQVTRRFAKQSNSIERAHGDGILIGYESPEALEEVFWLTFCDNDYVFDSCLTPHKPDQETMRQYAEYLSLVMRARDRPRYLSKNNNNILRLRALSSFFGNSVFLVPIRSPAEHALSLLSQHCRFRHIDSFSRQYFSWLGHHEFGATHKPFVFSSPRTNYSNATEVAYWLELWADCYRYLRAIQSENPERIFLVPYESLCEDKNVWKRLAEMIGIGSGDELVFTPPRPGRLAAGVDPRELDKANDMYLAVKEESLQRLFS